MSTRTHDEYKENIGAYLLGALPELEAEVFERHLAGCENCRAEVEDLRPVSAALARSVPQVEAPASLKASLMDIVNSEAEVRADRPADARKRERRSFGHWFTSLQPRMAAGMALAVLALGVVVGVAADKLGGSGSSAKTIAAQIDRKLMPTGNAALEVKGDAGELRLTDAPQPPPDRVYQLWFQHGKTIERGPTFKPHADGSYQADLPVARTDAVMVTVEKTGGATVPTGPPVMQFNT